MRRKFKSGTRHPVTIGTRETTRNPGSDEPFEMRMAKRVRFIDTKMDGVGVPVYAASSGGHEATQSPSSDAPKTSEYAYFVKVKNDAAHARCHSLHKKKRQLNSSTTNFVSKETISTSDVLRPSTKYLRSSVSGEMAGPSDPLLSPHVYEYDEPDQIRSKEPTNKIKKKPQLLSGNVTPVRQNPSSSLLNEASGDSGDLPCPENQCNEKEMFPAKRHRLCQRVSHISSFGAEKLHTKGFDLVSSHLSPLLPEGNERDWDKDLPKLGSGKSSEIVLSDWDTFVSGFFFPNYDAESHVQDELMDLDQRSKNRISRSSLHDCSFCTHYRSSRFHFNDLDEFGSMVDRAREPHGLSPEWDVEWRKHGADSSITNHDTAENVCTGRATTWNVNQQPIVDNLLDAKGLCPSPLRSDYYLEFGFPFTSCGTESHVQDEFMDPGKHSRSRIGRSSKTQHSFSFCTPFEAYRSGFLHLSDLDEFGSIVEHVREEPHGLSVEWGKDIADSSITNHDTAKNVCPGLATTWNVNQQQSVDNVLDAKGLCSSPLLSSYYLEFGFPFPSYSVESHIQDEFIDPDKHSRSRIGRSSKEQHGFSFCTPSEAYRFDFLHLSDLDEFGTTVERAREEPRGLSLEWGKDIADSSFTNHDTAKNVCPGLATTWNVNQQQSVDNVLDAKGLCSSPLLSNYYLEFGFPFPYYSAESHVQDEFMDLDQRSKSCIGRSSPTKHEFPFCTPFEGYRSGCFHFKDWDEFGTTVERAREEPRGLLLEWDFESGKDRVDSSIINHDTAKKVCPGLATTRNVNQQQIVDNVVDAKGLCSSPLLPNYYLQFDALPNYASTSCLLQNFALEFDDTKCAMAESGELSLALPCPKKCITATEDRNADSTLYNSNIIFSYRDQDWLNNKIWDGKPERDSWWKRSSAADLSAEDLSPSVRDWQFPQNKKCFYSFPGLEEAPSEPVLPSSEGAPFMILPVAVISTLGRLVGPLDLLTSLGL